MQDRTENITPYGHDGWRLSRREALILSAAQFAIWSKSTKGFAAAPAKTRDLLGENVVLYRSPAFRAERVGDVLRLVTTDRLGGGEMFALDRRGAQVLARIPNARGGDRHVGVHAQEIIDSIRESNDEASRIEEDLAFNRFLNTAIACGILASKGQSIALITRERKLDK